MTECQRTYATVCHSTPSLGMRGLSLGTVPTSSYLRDVIPREELMKRRLILVVVTLATSTQAQLSEHKVIPPLSHSVTLPAGTHILMRLSSPLHTTSAREGSGVYLETSSPVLQDGQIVIPARACVLGQVEHERRPGRVKGRAQFRIRFTKLILPGQSVTIVGSLQSLPGNAGMRTHDKEGTIEPVDQIDRDVYRIASGAIAGGLAGALTRTASGAGIGLAIGGGLGLAKSLFTRGDEIYLPEGTNVEMVLDQPVTVAQR